MEALFRQIGLRRATVSVRFCRGQVVGVAHRNAAHYPLEKHTRDDGEHSDRPSPGPSSAGGPAQPVPPDEINAAIRNRVARWLEGVAPNWTSFARLKLRVVDHSISHAYYRLRFIPKESRLFDALLTWSPDKSPKDARAGSSPRSPCSARGRGRTRRTGKPNRRRARKASTHTR
jgi:hypothetical protein